LLVFSLFKRSGVRDCVCGQVKTTYFSETISVRDSFISAIFERMEVLMTTLNGISIAEIQANEIIVSNVDDALDLIGNCGYQGADCMILHEAALSPEFFDLKTKLAGDILQKFSTYNMRLAIVGDFGKYTSSSLKDFIYESNKGKHVNFVATAEEAKMGF
jgi:hypothetical protein